jgi:hypothetical protein
VVGPKPNEMRRKKLRSVIESVLRQQCVATPTSSMTPNYLSSVRHPAGVPNE